MTENKRYIVDDAGTLIDIQTRECYDIVEEVVDLLNNLSDENEQLKQQISEQCIQLDYLNDENKHMRYVLNDNRQLKERIKKVETRNKRQYNSLKEIIDLILERDWYGFEKIIKDWEESERLLQSEWRGNCGDVE